MNTSSYSPIPSGTYNRWKVDFVLKTKVTKISIQRRLWLNFIECGLVVPIFKQSRSLLFEGKCVAKVCILVRRRFQQFSSHITIVSACYRELNAAWWFHFSPYNSGFPCAFICLSFMLMAVDFSRTQKGYSVHVFNLYYIVIDLEAGQFFVGRFQNFDYMHY